MNNENEIVTLKVDNMKIDYNPSYYFNDEKGKWLIELSEKGFKFNREAYPNWKPDDFAMAIIELLENSFDVKFTKK